MHILICNERFLFRFGLDRALIILGKGLKESGHTISIMANKYDRNVLETFATKIIDIPEAQNNYLNSNELTEQWINSRWNSFFNESNKPDIVIIGGWPFFSTIPFFKKMEIPVIFLDCGAVPLEGYTNGVLVTQQKLREMRKKYLKDASSIIAISDFIATTQSKVDTDNQIPVNKILLGADHLDMKIWKMRSSNNKSRIIDSFNAIKNEGKHCILNLGRWEPNCYKNSESVFDIMRKIKEKLPNTVLFVLNDPSTIQIPPDLQNFISPLGFPDDTELAYLMKNVDLGISTSLWEGFNLPLAEMQWLNVPVLVFNKGAHPEVVMHPWYLCKNIDEMAAKAIKILNRDELDPATKKISQDKFHTFFTWERVIKQYQDIFIREMFRERGAASDNLTVFIDVTNAARDTANSGVIRVTRRICREFQKYVTVLFVLWDDDRKQYVFPTQSEFRQLSQFNGPVFNKDCFISPDSGRVLLGSYLEKHPYIRKWLIFSETIQETRASVIRRFARVNNISLGAIFYDAIPVLHSDLCKDIAVKNNHGNYMKGLAECDIVIPISGYSAACLQQYWKSNNINANCPVLPNLLPGEFGGSKRNYAVLNPDLNSIQILCVSTLEPRKNHKTLIEACLLLQKEHPELDWTLTLVGNKYAGAFEIADEVQQISKNNPRIRWLGVVSDTALHRLYEEATFTVYPSIIEGFGMPILESIWHGKPVICSDQGVMSELAHDGGCLTVDILNPRDLSKAIYRLCTDRALLLKLSKDATERPLKSWEEYTVQFLSILGIGPADKRPPGLSESAFTKPSPAWEDILYPSCLCENWQMNHSERMALTALLLRHRPRCSIEIGTYKGGSLSLISQISKHVYSLDIDPSIPENFGHFKNVTFLTGLSTVSLPLLLKALDAEKIPVEFILIDGDHSAEGVKKDLNTVLAYVPKKPLFILMHDSGNPECRRGMLEADWNNSPYVQWVDLDFIPGRIVENGSSSDGEMWGGLALAYLTPTSRDAPCLVNRTANNMYEFMKTSLER